MSSVLSDSEREQYVHWKENYDQDMRGEGQANTRGLGGWLPFGKWLGKKGFVGDTEARAPTYDEHGEPSDDLIRLPLPLPTPGCFPPPFLKPELDTQDIEQLEDWKIWAGVTKVSVEALDVADSTIQIITMVLSRAHIAIRTERLTHALKFFADFWKPEFKDLTEMERNPRQLRTSFWLNAKYGRVYKNNGFQAPEMMRNWLRMRSRRPTYVNLKRLGSIMAKLYVEISPMLGNSIRELLKQIDSMVHIEHFDSIRPGSAPISHMHVWQTDCPVTWYRTMFNKTALKKTSGGMTQTQTEAGIPEDDAMEIQSAMAEIIDRAVEQNAIEERAQRERQGELSRIHGSDRNNNVLRRLEERYGEYNQQWEVIRGPLLEQMIRDHPEDYPHMEHRVMNPEIWGVNGRDPNEDNRNADVEF